MTDFRLALDAVMATERTDARAKVDAHFTREAHANLHADLVQLALENPAAILAREQQRQELLALIEAAQTPAEIEQALSTL